MSLRSAISVPDSNDDVEFTRLRNGVNRNTQQHNEPQDAETYAQYMQRRQNSVANNRGLHETMDFYDDCTKRDRNMSEWQGEWQPWAGGVAEFEEGRGHSVLQ